MLDTQQKVSGRKMPTSNTKSLNDIAYFVCVYIILFNIVIQFFGEMLKGIFLIEEIEGQFMDTILHFTCRNAVCLEFISIML